MTLPSRHSFLNLHIRLLSIALRLLSIAFVSETMLIRSPDLEGGCGTPESLLLRLVTLVI